MTMMMMMRMMMMMMKILMIMMGMTMGHLHAVLASVLTVLNNSTACAAVVEVMKQKELEYPQGARHVRCVITWAEAEKEEGEKRMAEASEVEKCKSAETPKHLLSV